MQPASEKCSALCLTKHQPYHPIPASEVK